MGQVRNIAKQTKAHTLDLDTENKNIAKQRNTYTDTEKYCKIKAHLYRYKYTQPKYCKTNTHINTEQHTHTHTISAHKDAPLKSKAPPPVSCAHLEEMIIKKEDPNLQLQPLLPTYEQVKTPVLAS